MKTLMILLFLMACLDVTTTHYAFTLGLGEANPIMDGVIQHGWGVALKLGLTVGVACVFLYFHQRYQGVKPIQISLWSFGIAMTLLMASAPMWNTIQILIMKGVIN